MIICLRTTQVLDDRLFRQAKRRAAERNPTLSDIVNKALRESFKGPAPLRAFNTFTEPLGCSIPKKKLGVPVTPAFCPDA